MGGAFTPLPEQGRQIRGLQLDLQRGLTWPLGLLKAAFSCYCRVGGAHHLAEPACEKQGQAPGAFEGDWLCCLPGGPWAMRVGSI